ELIEQTVPIRHVTETPNASDDMVVDALRPRMPFEDPPISELDRVVTLSLWMCGQFLEGSYVQFRSSELPEHEVAHGAVCAAQDLTVGGPPHSDELRVELCNRTL